MNARNPRFALLDSLRAIAALSVFGYHVVFHTRSLGSTFGPWLRHLNVGVPILSHLGLPPLPAVGPGALPG